MAPPHFLLRIVTGLYFLLVLIKPLEMAGQNHAVIDSLRIQFAEAATDSARMYWSQRLCWNYLQANQDTAIYYNGIGRRLALLTGDSAAFARSEYYQGLAYRLSGDYDSSLHYLHSALAYYEAIDKPYLTLGPLFNLGVVHGLLGNHEKALEFFYRELALNEAEANQFSIANTLNSIASVHRKMGNYDEAFKKFHTAKSILETFDKPWNLANVLSNIGGLHLEMNNSELAQPYLEAALQIDREINDEWGTAYNLHRLGLLLHKRDKMDSAQIYLREALEIRERLGQKLEIAETLSALGAVQFEQGNTDQGIAMLLRAAEISEAINAFETRTQVEKSLAQYYRELGQYAKSLDHFESYAALRDSVTVKEKMKIASELEARYESAKKDKQLAENELQMAANDAQIQQQRLFIRGAYGALIALLVIVVLLVITIRARRKLSAQRLQNLRKEQEITALKSMMEGEEKERSRIARELHDGLSSLLAAIKIQFNALQHDNEAIKQSEKFSGALRRLDEASKEVRRIAHNMMPEILAKYGLVEALSEYIAGLNTNGRMQIELSCYGMSERLPLQIEQVLYRVVQELLNNAIRHSNASEVMVQFNLNDGHLNVTVEDNGIGLDPNGLASSDGIGMTNLKSRVQYLHGNLHIESSPSHGTSVYIELEINEPAAAL